MLRNVIIPFILIVLTSLGTIYFASSELPLSLFGVIGFITLGFGSMYISFYIFYRLFPNKKNKPVSLILSEEWENYGKEQKQIKNKKKHKEKSIYEPTLASFLASIFTICMTIGGIVLWYHFIEKYENYQLETYGKKTKAVVIDYGYTKGIGTYRKFEFLDESGEKFTDRFRNETLSIGDSIEINYSTQRPLIHKVTSY